MSNVEERNKLVKAYVHKKLQEAKTRRPTDFSDIASNGNTRKIVQDLIFVKQNGFRGIVLTAIAGMYVDQDYDPLNNFYACNPRSIFEQAIWYALAENSIPCGKSDPLNVAKNANVIDENWANGKRPESAANAAVSFLQLLVANKNKKKFITLVDYFFFQLLQYAKSISSIEVNNASIKTRAAQSISNQLINFTLSYPESGTIPQFVVGKLIRYIFENSGYEVGGDDESVFGTNTTSKKPADIWVFSNGTPVNLYEITVKKIDAKRLDDCIDALQKRGLQDSLVTFICRVPTDCECILSGTEDVSEYKGKPFYIVDISNFITVSLSLLSQNQIDRYMKELVGFIREINRPVATKEGWKKIFEAK